MISEHVVLGPRAGVGGVMVNPRDYAYPGNQEPDMPWPSSVVLLSAIAAANAHRVSVAGTRGSFAMSRDYRLPEFPGWVSGRGTPMSSSRLWSRSTWSSCSSPSSGPGCSPWRACRLEAAGPVKRVRSNFVNGIKEFPVRIP
jgi:hypothetical protein